MESTTAYRSEFEEKHVDRQTRYVRMTCRQLFFKQYHDLITACELVRERKDFESICFEF